MFVKGIFKRKIYQKESYTVGLLKVKDNDLDPLLNDKTITFTGYFSSINIDDNLLLKGEFTVHNKYGEQFQTNSYEVVMPDNESGIITFLSSELFPGIGENKAQKIYDALGDDAVKKIIQNKDVLLDIKGLTKKNINVIYDKLLEYEDSIDTIVFLNEYGFNNRESNSLYNKYKNKIIDILDNNIYDIINDNFSFTKIDALALKHQYDKKDTRRVKSAIIYVFNEVINNIGDTYLTYNSLLGYLERALLLEIDNILFEECLNSLLKEEKVVFHDEKYYLKKMYDAENNIAKRFVYLNNQKDEKIKNLDSILESVQKDNNILYNQEQIDAIKNAFIKHFMIITGGPGTGKTTIIKSIVEIYQKNRNLSSEKMIEEVSLLAPTGRAAKRMMEKVNLPAQTIHRFLKWNKENNRFGINEYCKANSKLVIIDEASMVDAYLLDSLLKGLYYDTKIILVGDYNQLPSVGAGQVLKDLIESNQFFTIKLETLYRQEANSNIITLAYDVNDGILHENIFNQSDDLTYIECDSYNLIDKFSEICYTYKDYDYNNISILAPMYKTINGIDNLNLVAREIFNPLVDQKEIQIGDIKYRTNDKVLELVNMPDDNVYNGDLGIIKEIDNNKKEVYIDYDGNIVKYTKSNFSNFKLGYVTSIHKAQGSEFNIVIIIMLNEYGRMLYRKLFYTGITRAKNNLYLLGELSAMKKSVNNNIMIERKTTLIDMINSMYE